MVANEVMENSQHTGTMVEDADSVMSGVPVTMSADVAAAAAAAVQLGQHGGHDIKFELQNGGHGGHRGGEHMVGSDVDTQRQLQILASTATDSAIHPELQRLSSGLENGNGQSHLHSLGAAPQADMGAVAAAAAVAAANIMVEGYTGQQNGQNGNSQQQQQQEIQQEESNASNNADMSSVGHTAEDFARASGYHNVDIESAASTLSKRLAPQLGRRTAVQRRPEQVLNLQRRSNVEALLAQVSGTEAASACKNCHKGHGPWNTCVVVEGQMCGSCANCWYNASGSRCSFHDTNNPQAHQPALHNPRVPSFTPQNSRLSQSSQPLMMSASFTQASQVTGDLPHSLGLGAATQGALGSFGSLEDAREIIERAMRESRNTSARQRHLQGIEAAARELAWRIAEYERWAAMEGQQEIQRGIPEETGEMTEGGQVHLDM